MDACNSTQLFFKGLAQLSSGDQHLRGSVFRVHKRAGVKPNIPREMQKFQTLGYLQT